MNPRAAQKVALIINIGNVLLVLTIVMATIMLIVDYTLDEPLVHKTPPKHTKKNQVRTLTSLRSFWQTNILQKKPKTIARHKPVVKKQKKVAQKQQPVPFEIVTIFYHSNEELSYAVLQDKRTREQVLVHLYSSLPKSQYKVAKILKNKISLRLEETVFDLEKGLVPKSAPKRKETQLWQGLEILHNKIIVVDNLTLPVSNLLNGDQILAVNGTKLSTIEQFQMLVSNSDFAKITVVRDGEKVSVYTIGK